MTLTSDAVLYPSRRVGGLRGASNPLEGEWQAGIDVGGNGCLAPVRLGPCAVGNADAQHPSAAVKWLPATVRQIVECTTLGRTGVGEYARRAGDVTVDFALALELFDGAATENPHLNEDGVLIGEISGSDDNKEMVAQAIACIEAYSGPALSGRVTFIHVPIGMSIYLPGSIHRDGDGIMRTPAGNVIVVSPAYSGTSMFATGEVWVASQRIQTREFTDRADNTDRAWDDHLVLAVFDPCFHVEVSVDIAQCSPPSQ